MPSSKVISLEEARRRRHLRSLTERHDDALLLLARGGRRQAFEVLVRRHQEMALYCAARLTGDGLHAKDAVVHAFARLRRMLSDYEPADTLRVDLMRLVVDEARLRPGAPTERRRPSGVFSPPTLMLARDPRSDEGILDQEHQRTLQHAFSRLPRTCREVLALRYCTSMSPGEVAECLHISRAKVQTSLNRGIVSLWNAVYPNLTAADDRIEKIVRWMERQLTQAEADELETQAQRSTALAQTIGNVQRLTDLIATCDDFEADDDLTAAIEEASRDERRTLGQPRPQWVGTALLIALALGIASSLHLCANS